MLGYEAEKGLAEFGYEMRMLEDGDFRLKQIGSDLDFEFKNQENYEQVGDAQLAWI